MRHIFYFFGVEAAKKQRNLHRSGRGGDQGMSELPVLEGQIRVLVIDDDLFDVRSVLVRCTEAGMDTRYAPHGPAAIEAVRTVHPHIILLGVTNQGDDCMRLALQLEREIASPLLVLTDAKTNLARWKEDVRNVAQYIPKDASAQAILQQMTARIRDVYHEKQLMVAEAPADTAVPKGWGTCQSCGYIGPRPKFVNPNPLARHALLCPACKHSDDIVFAVA